MSYTPLLELTAEEPESQGLEDGLYTLPETLTYIAPEDRPSQREISSSNHQFLGARERNFFLGVPFTMLLRPGVEPALSDNGGSLSPFPKVD